MLEKVISGAQTGVDRAGLIAAKNCGLETGGFVCKNNKTEKGFEPELIPLYGLTEINSLDYNKRTLANVHAADSTWILYRGRLTLGSAITIKYCEQLKKPYMEIQLEWLYDITPILKAFLIKHAVKVLNIAGQRESKAPGIEQEVQNILMKVFKK
jgi:hypothetical protein